MNAEVLPVASDSGSSGPPRYYRVAEVAAILAVTRQHVYDLCSTRKLGHIRVGAAIRIPLSCLDEYLSQVTVRPDPAPAA